MLVRTQGADLCTRIHPAVPCGPAGCGHPHPYLQCPELVSCSRRMAPGPCSHLFAAVWGYVILLPQGWQKPPTRVPPTNVHDPAAASCSATCVTGQTDRCATCLSGFTLAANAKVRPGCVVQHGLPHFMHPACLPESSFAMWLLHASLSTPRPFAVVHRQRPSPHAAPLRLRPYRVSCPAQRLLVVERKACKSTCEPGAGAAPAGTMRFSCTHIVR